MKTDNKSVTNPEIPPYTKYYEHDGLLRAYANRAMYLAMLFGLIALAALAFAIFVRIQPPTVIRVDPTWLWRSDLGLDSRHSSWPCTDPKM